MYWGRKKGESCVATILHFMRSSIQPIARSTFIRVSSFPFFEKCGSSIILFKEDSLALKIRGKMGE